jgi:excisionase family DNA binding protein
MNTHSRSDVAPQTSKYSDGSSRRKQLRDPHPTALAYSVDEASRVLGVSRRTVYELIAEGRIRSAKLYARRLITRAELERFLAELASEAA